MEWVPLIVIAALTTTSILLATRVSQQDAQIERLFGLLERATEADRELATKVRKAIIKVSDAEIGEVEKNTRH